MSQEVNQYRVYADGSVAREDDFSFYDHSLPAYEYQLFEIPRTLLNYIEAMVIAQNRMHPDMDDSPLNDSSLDSGERTS